MALLSSGGVEDERRPYRTSRACSGLLACVGVADGQVAHARAGGAFPGHPGAYPRRAAPQSRPLPVNQGGCG